MGVLARLRETRRRRRERIAKIVTKLVREGVEVQEARRLAPLVARGELSIRDAKVLSRRLRRRRLKKAERRLVRARSGGGFAERLSTALEREVLASFQAWSASTGTRRRRKRGGGMDLGYFGPV